VLLGVGGSFDDSARSTPIATASGRFACCSYIYADGWRVTKMLFVEYVRVATRIRMDRKRTYLLVILAIIGVEVMCVRIASK